MPRDLTKIPTSNSRPLHKELITVIQDLQEKVEQGYNLSPQQEAKLETLEWVLGYKEEPNYE